MPREKAGEKEVLRHEIKTRVNDQKFRELADLLQKTRCHTMSELVRNLLHNKPVRIITVDDTYNEVMQELSAIRRELKAMGVNINQLTRYFNSADGASHKLFYALDAYRQYSSMQTKVDRLLDIVSKLSEKWLQE